MTVVALLLNAIIWKRWLVRVTALLFPVILIVLIFSNADYGWEFTERPSDSLFDLSFSAPPGSAPSSSFGVNFFYCDHFANRDVYRLDVAPGASLEGYRVVSCLDNVTIFSRQPTITPQHIDELLLLEHQVVPSYNAIDHIFILAPGEPDEPLWRIETEEAILVVPLSLIPEEALP